MVATPPRPKLDMAATLTMLQKIAEKMVATSDEARTHLNFELAIGALVQATSVVVTAHQLEERHVYLTETSDEDEEQPSSQAGGLRGRYPMRGLGGEENSDDHRR